MKKQNKNHRPDWDEYFIDLTRIVAERGTCDRGKSGCVIVRDKKILCTGYVGSPPGMPHCDDAGHLMHSVIDENGNKSLHCIRTIHAEENAILQAAEDGTSVKGGTLYCQMTPCYNCAKKIIRVGIARVVARRRYHADTLSVDLFKQAGVRLEILEDKIEKYKKQK